MNDMTYGTSYEAAREHMNELVREAEKARQVREATRRSRDEKHEFRPAGPIELFVWALSRSTLPTAR